MILITPAPGVPVVVILTLAVLCWNAPCPAVVRSAFHWFMPTVVVPAVSVAFASLNLSEIVASPNFQSVAVVIVVVTLPVTDRMILFAGRSIVLSVVVPEVERVIDSDRLPVTFVPPFGPVIVVVVAVVDEFNAHLFVPLFVNCTISALGVAAESTRRATVPAAVETACNVAPKDDVLLTPNAAVFVETIPPADPLLGFSSIVAKPTLISPNVPPDDGMKEIYRVDTSER